MNHNAQKIYSRNFSQGSLSQMDFQNTTNGQNIFFKLLLVLFNLIISIICGCLAGMLGGYISPLIAVPSLVEVPFWKVYMIFGFSILAAGAGIVETVHTNLIQGLKRAVVSIFISTIFLFFFSALLEKNNDYELIGGYLFISFSILTLSCFCIFAGSLSLLLTLFLFQKRQRKILFQSIFIVLIAIFTSYLLGNDAKRVGSLAPLIFFYVKALGGIFFSATLLISSYHVARRANQHFISFNSLREWAIAIASWGGTSFYNLDLSGINFTGSKVANTDFRGKKFNRTCLKDVKGLEKARVDNRYFDLDNPRVQKLLTQGGSENHKFSRVNLRGAYLQHADMRQFNLTETNLDCADLRGVDLRESILLRTILTNADLSRTDLTGACIKDWSFNQQTQFDGIVCDYVYREYEDDRPTDRYPPDRNFEPGEFQSLFQKLTNAVELVFKDQVDWRALSFTFDKFRLEDDGLELELKGVEQRGDYWIVKVTHKEGIPRQEVEQKVIATYEDLRGLLAAKDQQINRLMGIMENQTSTLQNQSEALRNYSTQPFGNSFNITGSTITNLTGSGQIEYTEVASQVRSIVAQGSDPAQMTQKLQQLLAQFQRQNVATTPEQQAELLRQLVLSEAEKDEIFKGFLNQQGQQILQGIPPGAIASAVYSALEQLR